MRDCSADAAAIRLMRQQHDYARVGQLYGVGLSRTQIAQRVRTGTFERVAYGVVGLTGRRDTVHGHAMRAVLTAGDGAVACRWTAAELLGIDAPRSDELHVVIHSSRRLRSIGDVRVHRTRWLPASHVSRADRVPLTTLPRTMVDCATELDQWTALAMLDSCSASPSMWRRINKTAEALSNGRAGVRAIADATRPDGGRRLRSVLERRAAEALHANGVPSGEWNVKIHDKHGVIREVDLCYPEQRLIVEFDGLRYHTPHAVGRRDRATDRRLQLEGWRVLRFTWRDVMLNPAGMAADVARALAA